VTSTPTERHFEEAIDWLLRLNEAQPDAVLHDQHQAWLISDPLNALAWQQARKGWMLIDKIEPATMSEWPKARAWEASNKVLAFPARRQSLAAWMIAAAAACLALAVMPVLTRHLGADYSTSTGEVRQIALVDGSTVQLAPHSSLSASLTAESRTIKMLDGRAFFDVAKDAARPFVVHAGDVSITVLGTAFDVRINDDSVAVAVRHGRVSVQQASGRVDERLAPGDQLTIHRTTGRAVAEMVPEAAVGSWSDGQLSVLNAPVSDVVAEIRRYHRGWIIIADDRLGAERVTGLYNLQNPDMALNALLQPIGGTMRQVSPFLTILSKAGK
jgi:transmembrane sensor